MFKRLWSVWNEIRWARTEPTLPWGVTLHYAWLLLFDRFPPPPDIELEDAHKPTL